MQPKINTKSICLISQALRAVGAGGTQRSGVGGTAAPHFLLVYNVVQ